MAPVENRGNQAAATLIAAAASGIIAYLIYKSLSGGRDRCPNCGSFVAEDARRCNRCGERF